MLNVHSFAIAVSLGLSAPQIVVAQDWSGLYIGGTIGYVDHDVSHSFPTVGAPSDDSSPDGASYGGFVGYGVQKGQLVFGGEIDFEGSNASGSFENITGFTSAGRSELNWQGSIRAILGLATYLGSKPTLFYSSLGWAYGDFDFNGGPAGAGNAGGYGETLDGMTIGVGMDARLASKTSMRFEYRYTDYGNASGDLAPGFPGVVMPVSVEQHAFKVGLRLDF